MLVWVGVDRHGVGRYTSISMMNGWIGKTRVGTRLHRKRVIILVAAGILALLVLVQIVYPQSVLPPLTSIDGIDVGGNTKPAATLKLDIAYANKTIDIYFSENDTPSVSPKLGDIGLTARNKERIKNSDYPWYLRIIPGSLVWVHLLGGTNGSPLYERNDEVRMSYIRSTFGETCRVNERNATLAVKDGQLELVKGQVGGICVLRDVDAALSTVEPRVGESTKVLAPVEEILPAISDQDATDMQNKIIGALKDGIAVNANGTLVTLPKDQLLSWIDVEVSTDTIDYAFNVGRAGDYMRQQLSSYIAVPAGITRVATFDFVETSRVEGASGVALDVGATLANIKGYTQGKSRVVDAASVSVAPAVEYSRTYSPTDTGLSALMQNYAQTHAGTYGVSLIELSGKYRRAELRSSEQFTSASTYKLFVAYSTLRRIESGVWKWTDQVHGGRDVAKCFDDMIVVSNNECGRALLERIGFTTITNEARAIGMTKTSFLGNDGIKTSAGDLALLLAQLQTGQILSKQSSRDTLINAMKRNIYRQGIPKGTTAPVADKVGFLDGLLHDAAIVYGSSGTYILVIVSDGASWGNIAELTREIETLRIQ